jgi:hypothetical protein
MASLPKPAGEGKPERGKSDAELVLQRLHVESIRAKLVANIVDTIGIALKQQAISAEDALAWARDERIIDLLQFGPQGGNR